MQYYDDNKAVGKVLLNAKGCTDPFMSGKNQKA